MQKAAKLALTNTLLMQGAVMDIVTSVGNDMKQLLNGHVVKDSVLDRHEAQEIKRQESESSDS